MFAVNPKIMGMEDNLIALTIRLATTKTLNLPSISLSRFTKPLKIKSQIVISRTLKNQLKRVNNQFAIVHNGAAILTSAHVTETVRNAQLHANVSDARIMITRKL